MAALDETRGGGSRKEERGVTENGEEIELRLAI